MVAFRRELMDEGYRARACAAFAARAAALAQSGTALEASGICRKAEFSRIRAAKVLPSLGVVSRAIAALGGTFDDWLFPGDPWGWPEEDRRAMGLLGRVEFYLGHRLGAGRGEARSAIRTAELLLACRRGRVCAQYVMTGIPKSEARPPA